MATSAPFSDFPDNMDYSVAYLVSRFPKLTETFILYEMQALENMGARIELFPLIHTREAVLHPEAQDWVKRAHYRAWFSPRLLISQLYWFLHSPRRTLGIWFEILSQYCLKPNYLLRSILTVWIAFDFAHQIQKMGIRHVHAHWATYPATGAYVINKLTGIPYSLTAHAHDIYVDQTMLAKKIKAAAFTVTISEHNRRFLQQLTSVDSIRVLHCGVDTNVFVPFWRQQHNPFTLITVASLEEKKGHGYLLEALRTIAARGLDFQCFFVGDGPLRIELEDQSRRLGLQDKVIFMGGLPRSTVIDLLQCADVMVLPSIRLESGKQEGIPVALMEGMAMKLPVIASQISGLPELVVDRENGLLLPEKDPAALAKAIMELYQDADLRRNLGENAREKILADFDMARSAEALFTLIKNVSGNKLSGDLSPASKARNIALEVEQSET
jgi:colanic acid/amylovoran biosynthesis glycosyltransferase